MTTNFLALRSMGVDGGLVANAQLIYLQDGQTASAPISLPTRMGANDTWIPNRAVKVVEPGGSALFMSGRLPASGSSNSNIWASFDEGTTWSQQYASNTAIMELTAGDSQGEMIHVMGNDDIPYIVLASWVGAGVLYAFVYSSTFTAIAGITTVTAASYTDGQTFQLTDTYGQFEIFEFDTGGGVTPGNVAVDISAAVSANDVRDAIISAVNGTALEITATNGGSAQVLLDQNIGGARGNGTVPTTGSPPGSFTRFYNGGWRRRSASLGQTNNPIIKFPYKGWIFYVDNNTALHSYRYNPARDTANSIIIPGTNIKDCGAMFTLDQRLFLAVGVSSPATGTRLYEYLYGTWSLVQEVWISYLANGTTEGGGSARMAAIPLPGERVLLLASGDAGGGFGLEAVLVTLAGGVPTPTRKTVTCVPLSLRGPSVVGDPDAYSVISTADNLASPGSPTIYIWFHQSGLVSGTVINLYELDYSDPDNPVMVDLGPTGITAEYSLTVNPPWGGGEALWSPGELAISIESTTSDVQGYRIRYRCSGDPGNANKTIIFKFSTDIGVPITECTLVSGSAVGGGTVSGNTIINVDADPSILHEVVWNFLTDGQPNLGQCNLQAFIV